MKTFKYYRGGIAPSSIFGGQPHNGNHRFDGFSDICLDTKYDYNVFRFGAYIAPKYIINPSAKCIFNKPQLISRSGWPPKNIRGI